jgi:hypothetical protein
MADAMTREDYEARLTGWVSHCVNSWIEDAGDSVAEHATHSITELVAAARAAGAAEERARECVWLLVAPGVYETCDGEIGYVGEAELFPDVPSGYCSECGGNIRVVVQESPITEDAE